LNKRTLKVLEFDKIKSILKGYVESSLGEEKVDKLEPSNDLSFIKKCQEETSEAVRILERGYNISFRGLKDVRNTLKKAAKGVICQPQELLEIADSIRVSRRLKSFLKNRKNKREIYENVDKYLNKLTVLTILEEKLRSCIVGPDEIADNASRVLKEIRINIENLQNKIKQTLEKILVSPNTRKYLQDQIITIRNGRYVVPIKREFKGNFPGLVHDESASGATLFIEPISIVNLNNKLKELKIKEKREIEKILKDLTEEVNQQKDIIWLNIDTMAQLDFIFAKARYSLDIEGTQPIIGKNGYINLKKARHPLLKGKVVPIDIHVGKEFNTLIITGPNTGGKTVTLKTVGLLTLMAQSGLHVPAKWGTEISVFEKVFANIGDEQSIEQSLSTFSSHMTNIIKILKQVNENSLVLLDELGAGTDPAEGAALAISILIALHQKGVKTVATTHYSELKAFAHSHEGVENASVEFDVETLQPTYNLLIGIPGRSNAFEIAYRLGLPGELINNARNFVSKDELKIEELLQDIYQNRKQAEREKEEVEKLSEEIKRLKEDYYRQLNKLKNRKEDIIKDAKREALEIVEKAKEEAQKIIDQLRKINKEDIDKNKKIEATRTKLDSKINQLKDSLIEPLIKDADKPADDLKLGDAVFIESLNQKGYVTQEPEGEEVQVQVGIMKINVPVTSLRKIEEDEAEEKKSVSKIAIKKSKTVSLEIDVRGAVLDDALKKVDKYIDDAYLAGLKQVSIIHGKGTGTLRKGIQDFLKNNSLVKSFRDGRYGEGGDGVTVVTLNL